MSSVKVSVIVPIYKAEQFIERCVRSLMEQSTVSYTHLDVYKRQTLFCAVIIFSRVERNFMDTV